MVILSVSQQILSIVCGLGVLQGFLLAGLIYFHPKSDRSVNIFLALYILCTSGVMTMPFIIDQVGWQNGAYVQPLPLLGGPLLYLYLRSFKETITWRKAWPHFIIFIVFFAVAQYNITLFRRQYPDATEIPPQILRRPLTIIVQSTRTLQQIIYYFLARQTLLSYQRSIRHLFSETSRINLDWARFLINGFLVLVTTFIVIFPLMVRFPQHFNTLLLLNMAIGTIYIYLVTYKGSMQHAIWQVQPGMNKQTVEEEMHEQEELDANKIPENKPKKTQSKLDAGKVQTLIQKIIQLMEHEKLYQETELTLQQLAARLNVPTYQVSQVIRSGANKNFYDLVNGYRVDEAKRLLLDPGNKNYTILSVGFEAGFNSKTTFNTVFKKFTGLTPTEFREENAPMAVGS